MRRSFDGLAMMARESMKQDPLSGHLFVFFNRQDEKMGLAGRVERRDKPAWSCE